MENCFAFNKELEECTCLVNKKCAGQECGFYKPAHQAILEAENSLSEISAYTKHIKNIINEFKNNQGY